VQFNCRPKKRGQVRQTGDGLAGKNGKGWVFGVVEVGDDEVGQVRYTGDG